MLLAPQQRDAALCIEEAFGVRGVEASVEESLAGEAAASPAVSYTHLDVYKRQRQHIRRFMDEAGSPVCDMIYDEMYMEGEGASRGTSVVSVDDAALVADVSGLSSREVMVPIVRDGHAVAPRESIELARTRCREALDSLDGVYKMCIRDRPLSARTRAKARLNTARRHALIARKRPLAAALPSVVVAMQHFLPAVVAAPTSMCVRATAKRFALTVAPSTIPGATMTRASMACLLYTSRCV